MFVGAGILFAVALSEQIVAHLLVKRRCIDPIAADLADMEDEPPIVIDPENPPPVIDPTGGSGDEFGDIVSQCAPGVIPALALRVHSDIGLLASIGMATAGGALRGRRQAWDTVFSGKPRRDNAALRGAGIGLLATGGVLWFSTGAASWGWLTSCGNAKCANRARLFNFMTRDTAALLAASGGALLAFAEVQRRATSSFERDRVLSLGVSRVDGGALLRIGGRL